MSRLSSKYIGSIFLNVNGRKPSIFHVTIAILPLLLGALSKFHVISLRSWSFIWPLVFWTPKEKLWLHTWSPMWLSPIPHSYLRAYAWPFTTRLRSTVLEQESSFPEVVQFEDMSQDLRRGCGTDEEQHGYHSVKTKDKRGFTPYCKGFGDVGL